MLGSFRLFLALCVALSHANFRVLELNPGVIAVVCFYMISGFVMTALIRQHYVGGQKIVGFYLDRALRLYPQYLFIAGITLIWFYLSGHRTDFLQFPPAMQEYLSNLLLVPLNYYMFNNSHLFTLIPPAWSLGAEIQFYLLIPILILFRLRYICLLLSGGIFLFACWGTINTEFYAYRLLPGVLLFFMLGSVFYDLRAEKTKAAFWGISILIFCGVLWGILSQFGHLLLPYNREVIIGLLIGAAALFFLAPLKQVAWDNRLGDLSYGVFLNHFFIQWAVLGVPKTLIAWCAYVTLSLSLAWVTQRLVEQPVLLWRRQLRLSN
ncbi:acyltransferase family protein [Undibacterium fentianense]|uniref:Acyltransferase n=1 Tax=Undibacterium fentianense TaxID=2828728 RepID=A0A941E1F9_9BURK|nr:acyltransferase [Undibacterium fentianense]MBR7801489.1 acyltransferase [Undibacterium fentianense]